MVVIYIVINICWVWSLLLLLLFNTLNHKSFPSMFSDNDEVPEEIEIPKNDQTFPESGKIE